jgi:hypothetical protein
MAKVKTVWKTKEVNGRRMMICQNSNPELSKYPEWGPENGRCDKWSEVGAETTAVICSDCTQRSLKV